MNLLQVAVEGNRVSGLVVVEGARVRVGDPVRSVSPVGVWTTVYEGDRPCTVLVVWTASGYLRTATHRTGTLLERIVNRSADVTESRTGPNTHTHTHPETHVRGLAQLSWRRSPILELRNFLWVKRDFLWVKRDFLCVKRDWFQYSSLPSAC